MERSNPARRGPASPPLRPTTPYREPTARRRGPAFQRLGRSATRLRPGPSHPRRNVRGLVSALVLGLVVAVAVPAQEQLQAVVAGALISNLDYASSVRSYERALRDRSGDPAVSSSSLTANIRYAGGTDGSSAGPGDQNASDIAGGINLSVPILDQLSLSSSVSIGAEVTGTIGASYRPFTSSSAQDRALNEQYLRAALNLEHTRLDLVYRIEEAAIGYVASQASLAYTEQAVTLEEQRLSITDRMYDLDEATYLDVDDAQTSLDEARNAYTESRRNLLSSRQRLSSLFGGDSEIPELADISNDTLEELARRKYAWLEASISDGVQPWSQALEGQKISLEMLQAESDDTWVFRPDVSVSASSALDFQSPTVSLEARFSPQQWNRQDVDDLNEDVTDAQARLAVEQRSLEMEVELAHDLIEIARRDYTIAVANLETARLDYQEIEALYELGERTGIELQQAGLNVESRRLNQFTKLQALNTAVNDALKLYGLNWYDRS